MPNEQGTPAPDVSQFATAEYAHIPGTQRCRICNNGIFDNYYRVNQQMACAKCAGEARHGQPSDSHSAFVRALLLGGGAAVLGMVLYAAFTIITNGFYLGYIAVGVGWLVGKAMLKGSNGLGGRRYQIAAVLLTYFAISVSAIPIGFGLAIRNSKALVTQQKAGPDTSSAEDTATSPDAQSQEGAERNTGLGRYLFGLLVTGLVSPLLSFREPGFGLINLVIVFVGLRIAYKMTAARTLEVDGPYPVAATLG